MTETDGPDQAREPGITIKRVFDAPREEIWKELTEPERFADWYGGAAAEVPVSTVSMDVREGGAWKATMFAGPQRQEIHWKGTFQEVIPPERLVYTVTDHPGDEAFELVTFVLTDLGDGRTEMFFTQHGGMSPESYERASQGWGSFFDRLAEHLTGT
jgi:uncharacterized protein YndB with AHSA1/START domain